MCIDGPLSGRWKAHLLLNPVTYIPDYHVYSCLVCMLISSTSSVKSHKITKSEFTCTSGKVESAKQDPVNTRICNISSSIYCYVPCWATIRKPHENGKFDGF